MYIIESKYVRNCCNDIIEQLFEKRQFHFDWPPTIEATVKAIITEQFTSVLQHEGWINEQPKSAADGV